MSRLKKLEKLKALSEEEIEEKILEEINCPRCKSGITMQEIAEMMNITEQRVEQILKSALLKMRSELEKKGFTNDCF